MIRISQLKINSRSVHQAKADGGEQFRELVRERAAKTLGIPKCSLKRLTIVRESIDARRKPEIYYIYTLDVEAENEAGILRKPASRRGKKTVGIESVEESRYCFPKGGKRVLRHPIVIVGAGPAGLFCAYFLALYGYRPILLERGRRVEERQRDVEKFWETGHLNPASNVQFGEGGAGTFSDGKLNTLVKDQYGRNRAVLQVFVDCGAREEILYEAKPHIGTDVLCGVVRKMRENILSHGGEIRFESCVTDVDIQNGAVCGVWVNKEEYLACDSLVLAVGHSARDTFEMLYERQIPMEAKAFAVGLRVEHSQSFINKNQYGLEDAGEFGAASYKAAAQAQNGRGVYSFCMCPGGYVVNASSEEGLLAVNGMSYSARDGENANAAVIVSVTPEDYGSTHPLAGVEFQRRLERRAYSLARGKIPMQRYAVFKSCVEQNLAQEALERRVDVDTGMFLGDNASYGVSPRHRGLSAWADVSRILPLECNQAFVQGMESFGHQIPGFDSGDVILSGVESRTSSPLRILRDDTLQSRVRGIYPCGEGAGYAGGITSAAMDGLKVAERLATEYVSAGQEE